MICRLENVRERREKYERKYTRTEQLANKSRAKHVREHEETARSIETSLAENMQSPMAHVRRPIFGTFGTCEEGNGNVNV
jgi:hypothetical protein